MGGGASAEVSQHKNDQEPKRTDSKESNIIAKSPFDGSDSFGEKALNATTVTENGPKISASKLKKMALGQESYKDKQRDYDATIAEVGVNKPAVILWSSTEPSSLHKGAPPMVQQDPLKTVSGARPTVTPHRGGGPPAFVVKPPPPRRVSSTPQSTGLSTHFPTLTQSPSSQNHQHSVSATHLPVIAPSTLPLQTAASEGPPPSFAERSFDTNENSSVQLPKLVASPESPISDARKRQQHQLSVAGTESIIRDSTGSFKIHGAVKTSSTKMDNVAAIEDDDDDDEDGGDGDDEIYDWIGHNTQNGYDVSASMVASSQQQSKSTDGDHQGSTAASSTSKPVSSLMSGTRPPPQLSGGSAHPPYKAPPDHSRALPIKPFPHGGGLSVDPDDDGNMASFSSNHEPLTPSSRPSIVPVLSIPGQSTPVSYLSQTQAQQKGVELGSKPGPPPKLKSMDGNHVSSGGGGGGMTSAMSTSSDTGGGSSHSASPMASMHSKHVHGGAPAHIMMSKPGPPPQGPMAGPGMGFGRGAESISGPSPGGPGGTPERLTTGGRGMRPSPPPKPAQGSHEVKETHDVKRNRAQLPSNLLHVQPTTGDWLKKRYIVNNYILLDTLGEGSYGEVRLCKDRTSDHLFAIKIISKEMLKKKKGGNTSETYFEDIKREIAIMKKLLHPNVLQLFEVLDDPNVNKMYLVLEYMKRGDLLQVLKEREKEELAASVEGALPGVGASLLGAGASSTSASVSASQGSLKVNSFSPLPDLELWNIFRQVAAGIRYLHYQNIVHGDIKPQNLLVGEDGVVKIADFGISKMLQSGEKLTNAAGTPAFMSPELCAGEAFSGQLADVWAMGATMFMLCFGHPPFIASNIMSLYFKIQNDQLVFPMSIDNGLRELLENMLVKDPTKRFSLQQVIMHPWMRQPPAAVRTSISALPTVADKASAVRGGGGGGAIGHGHTTRGTTGMLSTSFAPPPSYHREEAAAMEGPVNTVEPEELYRSIGVGATKQKEKQVKEAAGGVSTSFEDNDEELEDDDGDDGGGGGVAPIHDDNIMATKWGNDVFEMVDDLDGSDDSDDVDDVDDDDDDDDSPKAVRTKKNPSKSGTVGGDGKQLESKHGSSDSLVQRSEMSAAELERRSKQFKKQMTRKSLQNLKAQSVEVVADNSTAMFRTNGSTAFASTGSASGVPKSGKVSSSTSAESTASEDDIEHHLRSPMGKPGNIRSDNSNFDFKNQSSLVSGNSSASASFASMAEAKHSRAVSPVPKISMPKSDKSTPTGGHVRPSAAPTPSNRIRNTGGFVAVDDEETNELSMDDFAHMMDTLAMQPEAGRQEDSEEAGPLPVTLKISEFSAQFSNSMNNVGAAFHSEQGRREEQEDRCILLTDVSAMRALEGYEFDTPDVKEMLKKFSIACVFDGHSGWRCAEYLSQHMAPLLATHPKILEKMPDKAILETFRQLDEEICEILRSESDSSGSTATLALYDGRRHTLTVATVGDSLCVLSRSGRAVKLLRMHRLNNIEERHRVEKAGGTVINNRVNGILAVSRGFGDTQFKGANGDTLTGPVVATPELCTEVITPMTEFAIVASDGLWDVLAPQAAVNCVRKNLAKKCDLRAAAQDLVETALAKGSVDNVTVLLMSFHLASSSGAKMTATTAVAAAEKK